MSAQAAGRGQRRTGLGVAAVVAVALCCLTPALVAAGALGGVGALVRQPAAIVGAGAVASLAVARAVRRWRRKVSCSTDPVREEAR